LLPEFLLVHRVLQPGDLLARPQVHPPEQRQHHRDRLLAQLPQEQGTESRFSPAPMT
jgi:hypothetical protein